MPRKIDKQNLTYILANEEGRISWDRININPYVFREDFIIYGGQRIFDKYHVPKFE